MSASWQWAKANPDTAARLIRELQRENTELRNEIARLNGQTNWVCKCGGTDCEGRNENAALRERLDSVQKSHFTLSKDNAALRKDKERLDWLDQKIVSSWLDGKDFVVWDKSSSQPCSIREWLDAAQKEAQP
jgi:hypothetical protein